jgi:hypothetical protein
MEVITRAQAKARGLKRYFTGQPCKYGHIAERRTASFGCIACLNPKALLRQKRYYEENREEILRALRTAYVPHPKPPKQSKETLNAKQRAYYVANRQKWVERDKKQRSDPVFRKHERERSRLWRAAHRVEENERTREYNRTHPNERQRTARKSAHKRRAAMHCVADAFTHADWECLVSRSLCCHWCKRPWTKRRRPTHDHVIPLSRGGANTIENSVCACLQCNVQKNASLINPVNGQGVLL